MDKSVTAKRRSGGVLLHPTSLPGEFGIGDLGPVAFTWVDKLAEAEVRLWQVLPLGQTGYGDSPYQCFSAFAGNRYLVSPQLLAADGFVRLADVPRFPTNYVDYGWVISWKNDLLAKAAAAFFDQPSHPRRADYERFIVSASSWLDDYALFMSLKDHHGGRSWQDWEDQFRLRDEHALNKFKATHQAQISNQQFFQFLFFSQWEQLRAYANAKQIEIIGDLPIFVSMDSADVWANPGLFLLNEDCRPIAVAGVPPDYFSPTGQLWGNPLYNWAHHAKTGFTWWKSRLAANLALFDQIRIDHFRGFESYWQVPAGENTAIHGQWQPGPGQIFFDAMHQSFPNAKLIAEDLGVITSEVSALRDTNHLPGMKVLQFAFDFNPSNDFLPHEFERNFLAYTGTHDNDTTEGWFEKLDDKTKSYIRSYLGNDVNRERISRQLIRLLWQSTADRAVVPMQDLLGLYSQARMNFPGRAEGNWSWRLEVQELENPEPFEWLAKLNALYNR